MPSLKITKNTVDRLPFTASGQAVYFDTELRGFSVRVGRRSKSYFVQRDVDGRTVKVTIGRHGVFTAELARKRAQELLGQFAAGKNPQRERARDVARGFTLHEAYDEYLQSRPELRRSTRRDYDRAIFRHLSNWIDMPLCEMSGRGVASYHRTLEKGIGKASANHAMRVLRAVYNLAKLHHEDLPENPVRHLSLTRSWYRVRRRQRFITEPQLARWYAAVCSLEHDTPRDYLLLLIFTGLRRTEAAGLRWENVDLENRTLTIPDTKNHEPHCLPLSDFLYELLTARFNSRQSDLWVFPGTGKYGFYQEPKSAIASVKSRSGVEFSCHDLRRTFITIAERLDISAYALKHLLNHSTTQDVTAGYIIMSPDRLRDPMQRITDHIFSLVDTPPAQSLDNLKVG